MYDVEEDEFGRIWFTTDRGVVRYDGYKFETFTKANGLIYNTNFEIFKDKKNKLWFSGFDGSLSCYDGNSFIQTKLNSKITNLNISWVKGFSETIDGDIVFYFNSTSKITDIGINHFYKYVNSKDTLLIIKKSVELVNQLNKNNNKKKEYVFFDKEAARITDKCVLVNDDLIIEGFNTRDTKVKNRYVNNSKLKVVKSNQTINELTLTYELRKLYYNHKENLLYACTNQGLKVYKISKNNRLILAKEYFLESSLSSIHLDSNNSIWLTTTNKGVIYIPSFNILPCNIRLQQGEDYQNLESLENHLIISSQFGSVFSLDKNSKLDKLDINKISGYREFYKTQKKIRLSDNNFIKYEKDKLVVTSNMNSIRSNHTINLPNGDILYGTFSFAIRQLTENGFSDKKYFLNSKRPTKLHLDKRNNIWLGTLQGLYQINNFDYSNAILLGEKYPSLNTRISDIQNYGNEGILISTFDSDLIYYDLNKNEIIPRKHNSLYKKSIIHNFHQENDSTIWLATNHGIKKINFEINDSFNITKTINLDSQDGLVSNFIIDIIKWNNQIWFTSKGGISYFDPDVISTDYIPPTIIIDSININGKRIDEKVENKFKSDNNNLNISYTGISFRRPTLEPFYKYALTKKGEVKDWIYTDLKGLQFTNLKQGDYIFEISARNKNNNWSNKSATYSFSILPHFTQTLFFKFGIIFSLLLSFYLINRLREKQILEREGQKRLIQESELRAQKAELDALRGQMNPHFVYNALNSIQNFIFNNESEKANTYLSKISKLMRNSLEMSKLEFVKLKDELKFLKTYLELEQMRFNNKFEFEFIISENISFESSIPPLIIQPIIENTVKHGFNQLDYKGQITIEFTKLNNSIQIKVEDNGCGISYSLKNKNHQNNYKSLSTTIIKERIQILNSDFKNSKSSLLYYDKSEKSNETGTVMVLSLPLIP